MIDQFFEVSCEIEFSPEHYSDYCVLVPVSVIFPYLVKWRVVGWKPPENAFFAFFYRIMELAREKDVGYPVGVLASVILVKDEDSNSSRSLDYQTGFPADLSYSAMFGVLIGL